MRHQPAVGVHPFLDISQIAAFDDAVKPLGSADQHVSGEYTALLDQGEIQISMSRRGNPYDNARAERFMRTLKQEEVYGTNYLDLEDAQSRIGEFLEGRFITASGCIRRYDI